MWRRCKAAWRDFSPGNLFYRGRLEAAAKMRRGRPRGQRQAMTQNTHDDDVAFIRALAEVLRENDLSEVEVKREWGGEAALNVRVSRAAQAAPAAPIAGPAPAPAREAAASAPPAPPQIAAASDPVDDPGTITSPMVGTVYLQTEPGAPAFVNVGSEVEEGDTLVIVEAMKTMNHIPAPRAGKVKRIFVEDGAPVEFGAPLLLLD